jgi:hypothetical protein
MTETLTREPAHYKSAQYSAT